MNNTTLATGHLFFVGVNVLVIAPSLCFGIIQLVALWIVAKCHRLPFQIRYVTISFLTCESLLSLVMAFSQLTQAITGLDSLKFHVSRLTVSRIFVAVSWSTISHLSMDRMLSVVSPLKYRSNLKTTVVKAWIIFDWLFPVLIVSVCWTFVLLREPETCQDGMHFLVCTSKIRLVLFAYNFVHASVSVYAQFATIRKINGWNVRVQRTTSNQAIPQRLMNTTRLMIKMSMVYVLLHLPSVAHIVLVEILPKENLKDRWRQVLHLVLLACAFASSTFTIKYCVLKLDDCRRMFMRMFCCQPPSSRENSVNSNNVFTLQNV